MGSCFENTKVIHSWEGRFNQNPTEWQAKDCAAWMMVQFEMLNFPMPDAIVSIPNQIFWPSQSASFLLTQAFAKFIERPVLSVFKRDLRGTLRLKKLVDLSDQTLLLLTLSIKGYKEIIECAEIMDQIEAKPPYILSFSIF